MISPVVDAETTAWRCVRRCGPAAAGRQIIAARQLA
jgi:hypothetical protein